MTTSNTGRLASVTACVLATFLMVTSSVSEASALEAIDSTHPAATLQKETNAVLEPQSIVLLVMGMVGLVAVRRMQKA